MLISRYIYEYDCRSLYCYSDIIINIHVNNPVLRINFVSIIRKSQNHKMTIRMSKTGDIYSPPRMGRGQGRGQGKGQGRG